MDLEKIPVVTESSEERLNKEQLLDYRKHREDLLSRLLVFGKHPENAVGYS